MCVIYIHTYVPRRFFSYRRANLDMGQKTPIHTHTHTYTYTYTYTYTHAHTDTGAHTHIYVYKYIHIPIKTLAYTHTPKNYIKNHIKTV